MTSINKILNHLLSENDFGEFRIYLKKLLEFCLENMNNNNFLRINNHELHLDLLQDLDSYYYYWEDNSLGDQFYNTLENLSFCLLQRRNNKISCNDGFKYIKISLCKMYMMGKIERFIDDIKSIIVDYVVD